MRVQRLSTDARVALFQAATAEAAKRGDRYIGTEFLLLGLLADPDGVAERALGVGLDEARAAMQRLDGEALETIGVDGHLATSTGRFLVRRHLPFTSGAKCAIVRAVGHASHQRSTSISTRHLLLGLLAAEPPDPVALLLRYLGCDVDHVRQTVLADAD